MILKYSFVLTDQIFSNSLKDFLKSPLIPLENEQNIKFRGKVDVEFNEDTKELSFTVLT